MAHQPPLLVDEISLEPLKQNITACSAAANLDRRQEFLEYASEFHYILAELAGYHIRIDILRNLRDKVRLLGIGSVSNKAPMKTVIREHRAIYRAIADGDSMMVKQLVREHLTVTHERMSDYRNSRV